jgi:hypothetical protein
VQQQSPDLRPTEQNILRTGGGIPEESGRITIPASRSRSSTSTRTDARVFKLSARVFAEIAAQHQLRHPLREGETDGEKCDRRALQNGDLRMPTRVPVAPRVALPINVL